MPPEAIVIGAGFGGLALAIRLQSAGVRTLLLMASNIVVSAQYGG